MSRGSIKKYLTYLALFALVALPVVVLAQNSGEASSASPAGFGSPLGELIAEESGFVYQAWKVTRSAINILLIIALFAISFSNIARINLDTYTVKKALPNLIIGIILANASLYIIRFMVDINTVTTYFFVNQAGSSTFADLVGDSAELIGTNALETTIKVTGLLAPILILIFGIVTIVALLWLAFLFYFRLVAIYLLTILAPFAFVAYGIPGLDRYFKQWWQQFIKWLFMVTAMSAVFWLMIVIGKAGDNQSLARLLIMYALLFTVLTVPSKFGGAIVDKASRAFMKYTGTEAAKNAAIQASQRALKNAGRWAASRTPGLYRLQEWNKIRRENFEKDLENRRKTAEAKARSGRVGRKAAELNYRGSIADNQLAVVTAEQLSAALTPALARELNSSTISRTTAEKELEMKKDYEKLRYLADRENNEEIKKLTEKFAEVSSKAGALNEAVSTEDKMIIGKYTNSRYDILRQAQAFADLLEKEKEVMDELETIEDKESEEYKSKKAELDSYRAKKAELEESFNKSKAGHPDLANQTILEVAEAIRNKTIDGKVLAAEMRKQGVNYNKGIDAQTEDMRREGSIEQLLKENAEFLNPQGELVRALEKLASGQTVGLDIETQRKFDVLIYTLKDWLRSSRHPNHNAAIENVLKLLVKNGKQQIAYVDANGEQKQINADNVDEVISRISQMSGKEKSNLVQALYRHPAVGGSPAQHVQRF